MTLVMSYGRLPSAGTRSRSTSERRPTASPEGSRGGFSRLFCGSIDSRYRTSAMQVSSSSYAKWQTPEVSACTSAPPRPFWVISSPVTALTTSGPVMNICEVSRTMKTKSVRAGL